MKKKSLCIVIIIILLSSCSTEFESHIDTGNEYAKEHTITSLNRAVKEYDDALKLRPDYTAIYPKLSFTHRKLGEIHLAYNMIDDAIKHLKASIKYQKNIPQTHLLLAIAYANKGQEDRTYIRKAIEQYKKVIVLDAKNAEAYHGLGMIHYYYYQNYDDAIKLFKKAISINDDFVDSYKALAQIFYNQGRLSKSIDMYKIILDKYSDISPDRIVLLNNIAQIYEEMMLIDEAVVYWNKVLRLDRNNKTAKNKVNQYSRVIE